MRYLKLLLPAAFVLTTFHAAASITMTPVGNDVVAAGSGAIDLASLSLASTFSDPAFLRPSYAFGGVALSVLQAPIR